MSVVNSEMYESGRCCRLDIGSEALDMQNVSGLWSVKAINCRPSRKYRKCRIAFFWLKKAIEVPRHHLQTVEGLLQLQV
jgi:hypothetical protein